MYVNRDKNVDVATVSCEVRPDSPQLPDKNYRSRVPVIESAGKPEFSLRLTLVSTAFFIYLNYVPRPTILSVPLLVLCIGLTDQ